jgi:hypothetical protein
MDMQAATAPGRAYRDAFENLGKVGADVLNQFREAKKEKQEEEDFVNMGKQMSWESFKPFGVENEDERDAFLNRIKKRDTREQAINLVKFSTEQQKAQELSDFRALQRQQINQNMARQEDADQLARQTRLKEEEQNQIYDKFLIGREMVNMPIGVQDQNPLMRGVKQPTAQVPQGDYMGNRFMQTEQGRSDFTSMVDSGIDPSDALDMASKSEARFLANQPKPMTPKELADYEAVRLGNVQKEMEIEAKTNPKPTANLAYTDATINAISDAESLLANSKLPVTGFWGNMLKDISGTGAADLKNSIKTIYASIGFDKLQDMRDKSPTGGALGQVSERELAQLNASLGSLEQSQSAEQFKKNLMRVKDHYQKYYKATMAQVKAYEQGLKFKTPEEAMSWMDQNVPMGGKPTSDNQTNITTPGGWKVSEKN